MRALMKPLMTLLVGIALSAAPGTLAQTAPATTPTGKPAAKPEGKPAAQAAAKPAAPVAAKPAAKVAAKPAPKKPAKTPAPAVRAVSSKKPAESEQKIARRDRFEWLPDPCKLGVRRGAYAGTVAGIRGGDDGDRCGNLKRGGDAGLATGKRAGGR